MRVLVVHLGGAAECLAASSVNLGIWGEAPEARIYWLVGDDRSAALFKYTPRIANASTTLEGSRDFDVVVNLAPNFDCEGNGLGASRCLGFGYSSSDGWCRDVLYGNKRTNQNVFQLYYKLAGLSWRGQGYGVRYYPKSKTKRSRVGIAIAHSTLRRYIRDNLDLSTMAVWHVPFKNNVFRYFDEINRCGTVITDDHLTAHSAVMLRKHVYFLHTSPQRTRWEFFGRGRSYEVPSAVLERYA